jgi:S1-C subfamily serine protease
MLPFLLIIFLACGTVLTFLWLRSSNRLGPSQDAQPRTVTARGDLSELEKTNISIYESASPAVAHITSLAASGNPFSLNAQQIPKGTGSGFVWDTNGNIVTNYHVVEGAQGARVTLADHDTYDAVNVWASPENDIAVIQIRAPAAKLHPITIGSSHDLKGTRSTARSRPVRRSTRATPAALCWTVRAG